MVKVLESINIELPNYSSRCLQYVSANHLSALRTAASYFKHNEYYNFVTALIEFNADSTLIDQKADDLLEALCNFVMLEAKDVQQKSYCEYYLSDFSEAEIAALDSSYRTKMMEITFGRFVPRRLNGESLGNFIQPYADKCSNETLNEHSDVPKYKIVSFGDIVSDYGFLTDSDFIQMENAFLANKAKTDKNAEMPTLSADDIVQVRDIVSDEYEHYFERALL